ncbi:MAG: CvpA family protein [Pirellulaceae bacterium]|nr:CvpA family protein [Pirellulaceae bacterium]
MQIYDIIMLVVLGIATFMGAIKGLAWQVASLASIVVSYFVAYTFRNDVAKMIHAQEPWNGFLAMLLLYAGSSFIIWLVFRLLSNAIDQMRMRDFDRQLGALVGLGKGVLYCLLITMFAVTLLGPRQQQAIVDSRSGSYISQILAATNGIVWPKEVEQIVRPYLERVERRLEQRDGSTASTPGFGGILPNGIGQGQGGGFGFGSGSNNTLPNEPTFLEKFGNGFWQTPSPGTPVSSPNSNQLPGTNWPSGENNFSDVLPGIR